MTLLEVENLSIAYQTRGGVSLAVDAASFSLEKGKSLGIVGESGCGKTTIGMGLLRLLPENGIIQDGKVLFEGQDLLQISEDEMRTIRWKKISMIFQAAMNAWNPVQRVGEQIVEAIRIHYPDYSRDRAVKEVEDLYQLVDIPRNRLFNYPHEYSGGMKQRAIIAMALTCHPDLIIADEPTTALDVIVQDQIIQKIKEIQKELSIAVIFISHDIGMVAEVCHDIMVMYKGKIVEVGKREEVFVTPMHPYTKSLLSSYLTLDGVFDFEDKANETVCQPDTIIDSHICGYIQHCQEADSSCLREAPRWQEITPTHKALCRLCK
ncbi:MAG: ABC transporter ATP-binding protein [Desulfohalobiaceae bacterium]|nr:ABC transporter ATP-binding protein [Desulfohalobiaceae bacterium]